MLCPKTCKNTSVSWCFRQLPASFHMMFLLMFSDAGCAPAHQVLASLAMLSTLQTVVSPCLPWNKKEKWQKQQFFFRSELQGLKQPVLGQEAAGVQSVIQGVASGSHRDSAMQHPAPGLVTGAFVWELSDAMHAEGLLMWETGCFGD